MFDDKDLKRAKIDIRAELNRLDAQQNAKEVGGRARCLWIQEPKQV